MKKQFILPSILAIVFILISCGGGGSSSSSSPTPQASGNVSAKTVSGTASEGTLITGKTVKLKDAYGNSAIDATTNATGSYSIDVTGLTAPFLVMVTGTNGTYLSLAQDVGTANINPITTIVTALAAGTSHVSALFTNLSSAQLTKINANYTAKCALVTASLQAALPSGVKAEDYFTGTVTAGKGMDAIFDVYQIAIHPTDGITVKTKDASAVTCLTIPVTTVMANTTEPLPTLNVPTAAPTLVSISVTPTNPSVPLGNTQQFSATGIYSDGSNHDITTQVNWSSSNTAVAMVDSSGLVSTKGTGTATITAATTTVFISATATLTVTSAILYTIRISANLNMTPGSTQQLSATGTYSDGSNHDITTQVNWNSSDTSLATVNSSGLVTTASPSKGGTAIITATLGDIVSSGISITIKSSPNSIAVVPTNGISCPTMSTGVACQFGALIENDGYAPASYVTWNSSDTSVATVNSSGLVTAVEAGTATITATYYGTSGGTTVTVLSLLSISLTPINVTLNCNLVRDTSFVAMGTYSDGSSGNVSGFVLWSSSNEAVAIPNSNAMHYGRFVMGEVGTATITATLGGISASTTMTVVCP